MYQPPCSKKLTFWHQYHAHNKIQLVGEECQSHLSRQIICFRLEAWLSLLPNWLNFVTSMVEHGFQIVQWEKHGIGMFTVFYSGRLQQREDLQASPNESSQSDLYERFVCICDRTLAAWKLPLITIEIGQPCSSFFMTIMAGGMASSLWVLHMYTNKYICRMLRNLAPIL